MPVKILISDDSPVFRHTLRSLLESVDHWEIVETRDGSEAVAQAIATQPNVVILDLAMPVMDGLTAAREISKVLPNTPILMCTMHNSPQMQLEAQKAGARGTISKADSTALLPAIQQLLAEQPVSVRPDPSMLPAVTAAAVQPSISTAPEAPADPAVVTPPNSKPGNAA
jgi:DNA-binding NarL/FixJ family response regulator